VLFSAQEMKPFQRRAQFERTKSVQLFAQDLSEEQIVVMRELFDLCDADGDGNISAAEMRQVMNELGLQVGKEEFEKLFQELDTNSDKVISFGDFLSGLRWIQQSIRITSSSGAVPVKQQQRAPTAQKEEPPVAKPSRQVGRNEAAQKGRLTEAEVARMRRLFHECDEDKDGLISKKEFWNFLHKQNVEVTKEGFLAFFGELDSDNTGALPFNAFALGIQGIRKVIYLLSALGRCQQREKIDWQEPHKLLGPSRACITYRSHLLPQKSRNRKHRHQ